MNQKCPSDLCAVAPWLPPISGIAVPGLSSLGVPGVPWHPQILADQLTLSQPRGADYAHQIILAPPDFQTFLRPCIAKLHSSAFSA